jgi:di/tricarboxylate transporter
MQSYEIPYKKIPKYPCFIRPHLTSKQFLTSFTGKIFMAKSVNEVLIFFYQTFSHLQATQCLLEIVMMMMILCITTIVYHYNFLDQNKKSLQKSRNENKKDAKKWAINMSFGVYVP